jgi:hypothetical protein
VIYLASPYSHDDPTVRQARFEAACAQVAEMLFCGIPTFSPVVYSHVLAEHGLPVEWKFWRAMDEAMILVSSEMWVLTLEGWKKSVGVQAGIEIARGAGKAVVLVEPDGGKAEQVWAANPWPFPGADAKQLRPEDVREYASRAGNLAWDLRSGRPLSEQALRYWSGLLCEAVLRLTGDSRERRKEGD